MKKVSPCDLYHIDKQCFANQSSVVAHFESHIEGHNRVFMLLGRSGEQFEAYSPASVGEVVRDDPEPSDFRGIAHMRPDTGAGIVVAHTDYPEGLRDILRQLAQVHYSTGFCQRHELNGDRQGCRYHLIDLVLDGLSLLRSWAFGEQVVALALLALDMGIARTGTAEHPHHSLIQDMLGCVHRRVFLLIVRVELYIFHCLRTIELSLLCR